MLRVTANLAIDVTRTRRHGLTRWASADAGPGPADEAAVLHLALVAALRGLPRRQREAIALRYLADLSEQQVGEALGVTAGSVKTHIHRAWSGCAARSAPATTRRCALPSNPDRPANPDWPSNPDRSSNREQRLERIYQRGGELRGRHRRRVRAAVGGGAAVVVLLAGAAFALSGDDGRNDVVVTADEPAAGERSPTSTPSTPYITATTAPAMVTTVPAATGPAPVEPPPTTAPADRGTSAPPVTEPPPPAPTTVPPLVCRNSMDPACGPFYYDWTVPDRVAVISITATPAEPRVGEEVTFTVTMDDPDGSATYRWCHGFHFDVHGADPVDPEDVDTGETSPLGFCALSRQDPDFTPYGPWDPPPPFHRVETLTNIYEGTGERTFRYTGDQVGPCEPECPEAVAELTITVVP